LTRRTRRDGTTGHAGAMMAERKMKVQMVPGGPFVDGVEVAVESSSEKWNEYTLEDGTKIRLKPIIIQVVRITDQYDPEGNPLYVTKAQPIVTIVEVKESLKRKIQH
jgi:hypothetical protein